MSRYRFLLINAFSLAPGSDFQMRSFTGPKETQVYNYEDLKPFLADIDWDLHPGARATHGNFPVATKEAFMSVGNNRLPLVREACASGKYNAIVLLGGGDPGYMEAREIGHHYRIPITTSAHAQMHIATMLGNRFSVIDISEVHNMHYYNLVVQYRFTAECASIRCIDYPLPRPSNLAARPIQTEKAQTERGERSEMLERSVTEAVAAIEDDGAEVIILGCSAAFWMRPHLEERLHGIGWDVPVLEGYGCAIEMAKLLVNLRQSVSGLAYPSDRPRKWRRRKTF